MTEVLETGFTDEELQELIPKLKVMALAKTRNGLEADELVSDTIERALSRRKQFSAANGGSLTSWLYVMMKHLWLDEIRDRQTEKQAWEKFQQEINSMNYFNLRVPHSKAFDTVALKEVLQRMKELSDTQRQALWWAAEGMTMQEIAVLQGVAENTVKVRIHRARNRLKDLLPAEFL